MRCSEPGHRVQLQSNALVRRVAELGSLGVAIAHEIRTLHFRSWTACWLR